MRRRQQAPDPTGRTGPSHTLVGSYAVDAVASGGPDVALFERHLAACPDCRDEVAALREAASTLAVLSATTPPPRLRAEVMARIRQVRPAPPGTGHHDGVATRRRTAYAGAAAVAILAVGLGLGLGRPWVTEDLSPSQQVLRAVDARSTSVDLGDDARVTLVHSDDVNRSVIRTEDLPTPPAGSAYQLWYERDGTVVSAGLVPLVGARTVRLQGDARDADGATLTVEPAGGSAQPTSEPIAEFDFGP